MADGILSGLLGGIDRVKQSIGSKIGLLVDDPREYMRTLNEAARDINRQDSLAVQGERASMRGGQPSPEQMAAIQAHEQRLKDFALGFVGNMKPVGMTPQEIAHATAQKNAAEMLGLPLDNTPMDRAKALGYTTEAYHATPKQFTEFKAGGYDPTISGEAVWLSPYADYQAAAHNTGRRANAYKEGTNVMPLLTRGNNPMVLDDQGMLEWAQSAYANGSKEFPQLISPKTAQAVRQDYDSIQFDGSKLGWGDKADERIIFNPAQIRSRFAAFDPARINEPDLLAAGIPLGLLAGANVDLPERNKKKEQLKKKPNK
jgi:hypothetical protein